MARSYLWVLRVYTGNVGSLGLCRHTQRMKKAIHLHYCGKSRNQGSIDLPGNMSGYLHLGSTEGTCRV